MTTPHLGKAALPLASDAVAGLWLDDDTHRAWLRHDAERQLAFFSASLRSDGGFDVLEADGSEIAGPQELHTTTRLVHSFALAHAAGAKDCSAIIEAGLTCLQTRHHDPEHGGYVWAFNHGGGIADGKKLAYGHVFVLLAAASALGAGFDQARSVLAQAQEVIETRFWDAEAGLLLDEFNRDWTPFSDYRGYNSNMHGCEAFLAAFEATGDRSFLDKAGSILDFFTAKIAPEHDWRIPEHFSADWQVDLDYQGDPMFRPKGTTPGHSFELARLLIQYWDLSGRPDDGSLGRARHLVETALKTAWVPEGGFVYTLDYDGNVQVPDRYWWPVTEAIGVVSSLLKLDSQEADEAWYRKLWIAAQDLFVDPEYGGWFPEVDASGTPVGKQFLGKPDIYHALQATLLPLTKDVSGTVQSLRAQRPLA